MVFTIQSVLVVVVSTKQSTLSNNLCPEIHEKLYHPIILLLLSVSLLSISVVRRSYQNQWLIKWKRLHYDTARDVSCHYCVLVLKLGKVISMGMGDNAFVYKGYSNWKAATGNKGAFCNVHKLVIEHVVAIPCFLLSAFRKS